MAENTSLDVNMSEKHKVDTGATEHHRCCHHFHYKNAQQYAQSLRPWLWQYQNACIMQNLANCLAMQPPPIFPPFIPFNNVYSYSNANDQQPNNLLHNRFDPHGLSRSHNVQNANLNILQNNAQPEPQPLQGSAFKVPPFWKRMVAELIDFTFLFYIKMTVSLFFMAELNFDQLSFLNADDILDNFSDLDLDKAFAITFEVIALEVMNRILITIFETLCLYRPHPRPGGTGTTPGKRLLGLKVLSCDQVQSLGHGQVLVLPAGPISFKNAFLRSAVKNFTIAFFMPVCLTLFFFKHNRAAYDIIAHTIVVEDL